MKPTDKQLQVLKVIEDQIKFWQYTNDLYSPSHLCEIETDIVNLTMFDDLLTKQQENELSGKLIDLLYYIRNLEK